MSVSLPEAFISNMQQLLGNDYDAFHTGFFNEVQASVRLNTHKVSDAFTHEESVAWSPQGKLLTDKPSFIADPLFHAGAYYVQESSSQFLCHVMKQLLADKTNQRVLDLCAAPGAKSTLIASQLDENSLLVANEIIKSRVKVLEENIVRWGLPNVLVSHNDPADFAKTYQYFDIIAVDVPCSNEGMFKKNKTAIEEWTLNNVNICQARQRKIISNIYDALKPGGFLVYSTCTFNKQENEDNVLWMQSTLNLKSVPVQVDSTWPIEGFMEHTYRFWPHKIKGEGMFLAVLQKPVDSAKEHRFPYTHKQDKKINSEEMALYLNRLEDFDLSIEQDEIIAIQEKFAPEISYLNHVLNLKKRGITVGTLAKNGSLVPDHHLSQSILINKNVPSVELSLTQAQQFLQKQNITVPSDQLGWHLVTYNTLNLGWIKILANRVNNYLPNELRILKTL
ncbi:MAG: methyltransferase domain-containing protein [Bacteroidota bacterium]